MSTNGTTRDGITSWTVQTFGLMNRRGINTIDTIAFDDTPGDLLDELQIAGICSHILPSRRQRPFAYMRALRALIKKNQYEVIHINGNSGTVAIELACSLGTTAKARIVHSRNTQGKHPIMDRVLRPAVHALCTDRAACGRDAGKWLFGERDFTVLPNGRDLSTYVYSATGRDEVRAELGLTPQHIAVGHVGNFNPEKNHKFLIEAFAQARLRNPKLRLFLLGDGNLRSSIVEQVQAYGLTGDVTLLGRTPRVAEYLTAFDLAVLPSTHEGFPNVVIESQLSGLPILVNSTVTDECAVTELVHSIPANDLSRWVERIQAAAPIDREPASRAARERLKSAGYDAETSALRLRDLYDSIAERDRVQPTSS
ncbi:glycosyltransferase [Nesterenkonia populi]|uniref:glycosyltransferase n=1 Tax=Nesterenkonia populi TaxID=1591087 RepID=UPI0014789776|nr:glycosyltransferase [Nesterenkonia populi]